ncbi:AAA family ATPase [Vibrio fluvialis]
MNQIISQFSVRKLFGCQDVNLVVEDNELILIGENGSGKTTVMNMFYHMLSGDFKALEKYEFSRIELKFVNEDKITFTKYELTQYLKINDRRSLQRVKRNLSSFFDNSSEFKKVIREVEDKAITTENVENGDIAERLNFKGNKWEEQLNRDFKLVINHPERDFERSISILRDNLGETEILYFPTYRRVEEDLKNLEIEFDEDDDEFDFEVSGSSGIPIQFGMSDVNNKFEEIKSEVSRLSSKALTNLSGEILRQLVRGDSDEITNLDDISESDVEVVLARLGTMFSDNDRKGILEIVKSGEYPESDKLLVYFLSKLVEVYDEQKEIDIYTDKFVEVCNKYLEQTKLVYDKSNVDIYVYSNKSNGKIELNSLSSGEQQIVSLFSKIHLNSKKQFIVLFDEPELSLSIFWQMNLLPDIVDSGKCNLLISVTHSPFIYDNKLKSKARNLSDFITAYQEGCDNA